MTPEAAAEESSGILPSLRRTRTRIRRTSLACDLVVGRRGRNLRRLLPPLQAMMREGLARLWPHNGLQQMISRGPFQTRHERKTQWTRAHPWKLVRRGQMKAWETRAAWTRLARDVETMGARSEQGKGSLGTKRGAVAERCSGTPQPLPRPWS